MSFDASSPLSDQLASKDCRVCNRRRIHCDRTLPRCQKCARKGVECPGYGPRLQWTNAIAVRGRFKGRGAPDISQHVHTPKPVSKPRQGSKEHDTPSPGYKYGLALAQHLSPSIATQLLQYYSENIAPLMVWLDSEQNQYKRLVIPLAETDPVLRLALLAISAGHMPDEDQLPPGFSQSTGEAAILMITEQVREMTERSLEDSRVDENGGIAAGMLAAMLILSNNSLLKSELFHAQSHRQAARILMNSLSLKRSPDDDLTVFLKNQLAIYDVLACTTLFNYEHIRHAVLPEIERQDVPFGMFLSLLHQITLVSLRETECAEQPANLEEEFELASGSTLVAVGPLAQTLTNSARRDFIRLVQAYHHAGMLFAYKRLRMCLDDGSVMELHSNKLFRALEHFEDINASLHNLAWPLFIAGTSCCGDAKRMATISGLCQNLSANTRFEHYGNLLIFLQELWQISSCDWILLARQWENNGTPVIAV